MPILTAFPRGSCRDGGKVGPTQLIAENPLRWTSRYGSLVTTIYGVGIAEGVNERGLAVHLLYLGDTDFGPRDPALPGVQAALWPQYLLDNAASVDEALSLSETFQVVMMEAHGHRSTVHLSLEDTSGDSAIIEFVDGKRTVYHSREYTIQTNAPPYNEQLELLGQQDFSHPSNSMPLPGNVNAVDRFQRAAYFSALLPEPRNDREAVSGVLAIARNVSIPFGAPYEDFGVYNTEYRTVSDLTNLRYFFELSTSPNVVWVEMTHLDFSPGAPVKMLDPDNIELSGDVSSTFETADAPF